MMSLAARRAAKRVASKEKRAGKLGARRSVQIKRLIALDAKMDKLRSQYRAVEAKIASIDHAINSLGFGG
jgi:predicted  nucleic acid-binding Zn-ribbon protein